MLSWLMQFQTINKKFHLRTYHKKWVLRENTKHKIQFCQYSFLMITKNSLIWYSNTLQFVSFDKIYMLTKSKENIIYLLILSENQKYMALTFQYMTSGSLLIANIVCASCLRGSNLLPTFHSSLFSNLVLSFFSKHNKKTSTNIVLNLNCFANLMMLIIE